MAEFVNFGNFIVRRDAIESIEPVVSGRKMLITITLKSGNTRTTEYYIGKGRDIHEFEFKRAWGDVSRALGEDLPRDDGLGGEYRVRRPIRDALLFIFYGIKILISPLSFILRLIH